MNHRVLELLKAPKNIQSEDLSLLKEEINSFPYVQNIRALYLYGVHLYDKENYQRVLSTTAAYTTDKKILYHLINGKIQQQPKPERKQDTEKPLPAENPLKVLYQTKATGFPIKREDAPADAEPEMKEESPVEPVGKQQDAGGRILPPPREEIKHLYVNGARNRILFEGEENFLDDDTVETIDLASTLESGSIVTQKIEKKEKPSALSEQNHQAEDQSPEISEVKAAGETEASVPATADEEEEINAESEEISSLDESVTVLHKKEEFKPDVQNGTPEKETENPDTVASESGSQEIAQPEETEEYTPETIIGEENISTESAKEEILDESELSFHETEAFMPEIHITADEPQNSDPDTVPETAEFTPEKIIDEDEISSAKVEDAVQDESELSFHGTESFLPEVKIQANEEETISKMPQQNLSKHEDEMRRLIEEVERKMKEKAASEKSKKEEEPENTGHDHDISFAETQQFEVKPAELEATEKKEEPEAEVETSEPIENQAEEQAETRSWKPMSFDSNIPDSLLNKTAETPQPVSELPQEETAIEETQNEIPKDDETAAAAEEHLGSGVEASEDDPEITEQPVEENDAVIPEKTEEEERVMNVSFFGSGWTIPQSGKKDSREKSAPATEEKSAGLPVENVSETPKANPFDSNVPGFINTWQSWLKIDRTEEVGKEKTEDKNKVIEAFIENNPRISQLKDESSFVVREKGDDISHLMTETLANLYFEQKLYTKAIKAFEILIKKTPEKKKYYEGKIQEIKDFKTKG